MPTSPQCLHPLPAKPALSTSAAPLMPCCSLFHTVHCSYTSHSWHTAAAPGHQERGRCLVPSEQQPFHKAPHKSPGHLVMGQVLEHWFITRQVQELQTFLKCCFLWRVVMWAELNFKNRLYHIYVHTGILGRQKGCLKPFPDLGHNPSRSLFTFLFLRFIFYSCTELQDVFTFCLPKRLLQISDQHEHIAQ